MLRQTRLFITNQILNASAYGNVSDQQFLDIMDKAELHLQMIGREEDSEILERDMLQAERFANWYINKLKGKR